MPAAPEWPMYRRNRNLNSYIDGGPRFDAIRTPGPFERLWPDLVLGDGGEEVISSPLAEYGLLIVCGRRGTVYFINRLTGELVTDLKVADLFEPNTAALVHGSTLLVGASDQIVAIDLLSAFRTWSAGVMRPAVLWRLPVTSGQIVHPINLVPNHGNGRTEACAVAVTASKAGRAAVYRVGLANGNLLHGAPRELPCLISAPVVDHYGSVLLLGQDGCVYRLAPEEEPGLAASPAGGFPVSISVAPAWVSDTFFFFSEDGFLCACQAGERGLGTPTRISDSKMFGVRAFAASERGFLVAHGKGISRLSVGGKVAWTSDSGLEPVQGSPIIAGDCGVAVSADRGTAYVCDFQSASLRFHQFGLGPERTRTSPAFVSNVIYSCSLHGVVSAARINVRT